MTATNLTPERRCAHCYGQERACVRILAERWPGSGLLCVPCGVAACRHCRRLLSGRPYWAGGDAYLPESGDRAARNYYGGYVCSRRCDELACLAQRSDMPGAGQANSLNGGELRQVNSNWGPR